MGEKLNQGSNNNTNNTSNQNDYKDMVLYDLDNNKTSLNEYKGLLILNFFTTWCPACKQEKPSLQKLHQYLSKKDNNIKVVSIAVKENLTTVKNFIKEHSYTFPVFLDADGKLARQFKVSSIPVTFLISEDGQIKKRFVGALNWMDEKLINFIEEI